MAHPHEIRDMLWHVELMRAFQEQKDKTSRIAEDMERLQQEANQLQQQVEYLSKCQWPREMALWPPERKTWSKAMTGELRLINLLKNSKAGDEIGGEDDDDRLGPGRGENVNTMQPGDKWDFEKLVGKWKQRVKEDRHKRGLYGVMPEKEDRTPITSISVGNGSGLGTRDSDLGYPPGQPPIVAHLKRSRTEGDVERRDESNGGSPVNGIVNIGEDGKEQGERRAPRRTTKNITFVSDC
jgi:hypothetical protein